VRRVVGCFVLALVAAGCRAAMELGAGSPIWELARSEQERRLELERRTRHVTELRSQLDMERERVLNRVLPLRYALHREAQVFPLTVEVRLPG